MKTIKLELTPEQADLVVKTLRYAANAASVAFAEAPIQGDINRVRYVATYIEHKTLDYRAVNDAIAVLPAGFNADKRTR